MKIKSNWFRFRLGTSTSRSWFCKSRSKKSCQCLQCSTKTFKISSTIKSRYILVEKKQQIVCSKLNQYYCFYSATKPLYDKSGLLISDQTDRCDCNRLKCQGCFLPCSNCQSPKCGLECRTSKIWFVVFTFAIFCLS